MTTKSFPNPKRPHSLQRIVKKFIADPEYARFIHREVRKARGGDRAKREGAEGHRAAEAHEPQRHDATADGVAHVLLEHREQRGDDDEVRVGERESDDVGRDDVADERERRQQRGERE